MRKLHLTIHNKEVYEQVLEYLKQFSETQLQFEREYSQSDFDCSVVDEPAINYLPLVDEQFDETKEYNPSPDDPVFLANKRYLEKQLEEIKTGNAVFYSFEDFVKATDALIAKYENRH